MVVARLPVDPAVRAGLRGEGRVPGRSNQPRGIAVAVFIDSHSLPCSWRCRGVGHAGPRGIPERDLPKSANAAGGSESASALPLCLRGNAFRIRGVARLATDEPEAVPAGFHAMVG